MLGAIILKWMHETFVRIEQREKNKIFKKEDIVIILKEADQGKITYRLLTPEEIEQKEYEHHLEQEKQQKELEQD